MKKMTVLMLGLWLFFPLSLISWGAGEDFFPLKDLRRGQIGEGKTDLGNGRVEKFSVEMVGTMPHPSDGDAVVVLAKMRGDLSKYTIAGMSGSPVYIKGKLLGAFAFGFGTFADPAVCGITPIDYMRYGSPRFSRYRDLFRQQDSSTAGHPGLERDHIIGEPSPEVQPGSAINVALIEGDATLTVNGTVTFVDYGGTILALGHSFLGMGSEVRAPVYLASVLYAVKSPEDSFKMISGSKQFIGAMVEDDNFGIKIYPLTKPPMLPVDFSLDFGGQKRDFYFQTIRHPYLSPRLVQMGMGSLFAQKLDGGAGGYFQFSAEIELENLPTVRWSGNAMVNPKRSPFKTEFAEPPSFITDFFSLLAKLERSEFPQVKIKRIIFSTKVYDEAEVYTLDSALVLNASGQAVDESKPGEKLYLLITMRNSDGSKKHLFKEELPLPDDFNFKGEADDKKVVQLFLTGGTNYVAKVPAEIPDDPLRYIELLNQRISQRQNNKVYVQVVFPPEKDKAPILANHGELLALPNSQWLELDAVATRYLRQKSSEVETRRVYQKVLDAPSDNAFLILNKQLSVTLLTEEKKASEKKTETEEGDQ